jgi:hypothetical protein
MQSALTSHPLTWMLTPEGLVVAGFFLLAALILFLLALEAGTYPEIGKGLRKAGDALARLRSHGRPKLSYPDSGHIAGR